jgi:hypothetical protein
LKNKNSHKNPGRKIRFFKRNASHALCILMPLSTLFHLYVEVSFIGGKKPEYEEKPCRQSLINFIT